MASESAHTEQNPDESARFQRAAAIAFEVVRRRNDGEIVTDEAVVASHPELAAELRSLLSGASVLRQAAGRATVAQWEHALARMEIDDERDAKPQASANLQQLVSDEVSPAELQEIGGRTLLELADDIETTIVAPPPMIDEAESKSTHREPESKDENVSDTHCLSPLTQSSRTRLFRPVHRPPTAVLQVYDDNLSGAERVRIRVPFFTVGREAGDFLL